jgi:predicted aconitase
LNAKINKNIVKKTKPKSIPRKKKDFFISFPLKLLNCWVYAIAEKAGRVSSISQNESRAVSDHSCGMQSPIAAATSRYVNSLMNSKKDNVKNAEIKQCADKRIRLAR